jgi:K+-transporting ATPase ATPase C chain
LAVVFFENFSKENPGRFPSSVTANGADGKPVTQIEPVKEGADIQSTFFDMWRQEHPDVALQDVPGDMVTTSASGLDPDISLQNAEFQLDHVAAKWAADVKRDTPAVRAEIEKILQDDSFAPFNGLAGEKLINVLQVNLELRKRYGAPPS